MIKTNYNLAETDHRIESISEIPLVFPPEEFLEIEGSTIGWRVGKDQFLKAYIHDMEPTMYSIYTYIRLTDYTRRHEAGPYAIIDSDDFIRMERFPWRNNCRCVALYAIAFHLFMKHKEQAEK